MQMFFVTLKQMLMIFTLILIGFLLRKKTNLPENTGIIMAKLETFVFVPALTLFTQMTKCTVKTFQENAILILYGLCIVVCAALLSYPLSRCLVRKRAGSSENEYQRNIYKYALTFANNGYMGNFIILGIWGETFFYQYSLFCLFLGVIGGSWGLYILIPKEKNAGIGANLKKGLLSPPMIALVVGMLLGLLDLAKFVPDFILDALNSAGQCQGPVAMVLAGFIIGGYNIKELLLNKKVYIATFLRLIAIPAAIMIVLQLLGTEKEIMTLALVAFATPLGLNTIIYPAAYGGDTKTGAAMTMLSHTLSVITIPLMYLLFIVLL